MQVVKGIKNQFLARFEDLVDDYIIETISDNFCDLTGKEFDDAIDNDTYRADARLELMSILEEEYFNK